MMPTSSNPPHLWKITGVQWGCSKPGFTAIQVPSLSLSEQQDATTTTTTTTSTPATAIDEQDTSSRYGSFAKVAAGPNFVLGVTGEGRFLVWGPQHGMLTTGYLLHDSSTTDGAYEIKLAQNALIAFSPPTAAATTDFPNRDSKIRTIKAAEKRAAILFENGFILQIGHVLECLKLSSVKPFFDNSCPSRTPIKIAAGRSFNAVLTKDGSLWTWGDSHLGSLACTPNQITLSNGTQSADHQCNLNNNNNNDDDNDNNNDNSKNKKNGVNFKSCTPIHISFFDDKSISKIYAAGASGCALSSKGLLYTWGDGRYGVLGIPYIAEFSATPQLVNPLFFSGAKIIRVRMGKKCMLALTEHRDLFIWGKMHWSLKLDKTTRPETWRPQKLGLNDKVLDFAVGTQHIVILTVSGRVITMGTNHQSQCLPGGQNKISELTSITMPPEYSSLPCDRVYASTYCSGLWKSGLIISIDTSILAHDMSRLMLGETGQDVTIRFSQHKGQPCSTLSAHSWLLRVRSPRLSTLVEEAMSDRAESSSGTDTNPIVITIPECACPSFQPVLRFIYTGELPSQPDDQTFWKLQKLYCSTPAHAGSPEQDLCSDLRTLYLAQQQQTTPADRSHVAFLLGDGKQFRAHRRLLAIRSPLYFRGLLDSVMLEGHTDVIEVSKDISGAAFAAVLEYLYCDDANIDEGNAIEVMILAREYQLNRLFQLAERHVVSMLDDESLPTIRELAERYELHELYRVCKKLQR